MATTLHPGVPSADADARAARGGPRLLSLLVVALVAAGLYWAVVNLEPLGMRYGPSCAVGVTGRAVTVAAKGWTAPDVCAAFRQRWPGASYDRTAPSDAPVICESAYAGSRIVVRDDGWFKMLGNESCASLEQMAATPDVLPSGPLRGLTLFWHWATAPAAG
jgi:hypothetical protein